MSDFIVHPLFHGPEEKLGILLQQSQCPVLPHAHSSVSQHAEGATVGAAGQRVQLSTHHLKRLPEHLSHLLLLMTGVGGTV